MTCTLALTAEQLEQVYRLRYTCYHRKGAIDPHPEQRFTDAFDQSPNHFSFLVTAPDPLATVRISVVCQRPGWCDSPALHVYGDHPALAPIARDSFVEASRLCFLPQARRDTFVKLVAHMAALADLHKVSWLIACPRVEHAATYQRAFGFAPLAEPRRYFGVAFHTQLLGIRREQLRDYIGAGTFMSRAWSDALHAVAAS